MSKIHIEEILHNYTGLLSVKAPNQLHEAYKAAIKEIVEVVIDQCAEEARAKENLLDYGTGEIWVDKKSILQVKQQIDYD